MSYPDAIAVQLERNKQRRKIFDITFSTGLFLSLIAAVCWALISSFADGHGGVVARMLIVLGAFHLLVTVVKTAQVKFELSYAPTYIIDGSNPDLVRLYGAVAADGKDGAVQKLLSTHPGLELYSGDTYGKYGCTLAAIPMTLPCPGRPGQTIRSRLDDGI